MSVTQNAFDFVVGKHSVWVELAAYFNKTRPSGMNGAQLIDCQLEVFCPMWSAADIQHNLLESRPVLLVFHLLAVRPANSVRPMYK